MVRRYIVKGRVQGVGFRWFVQQRAAEIGLNGRVRNTPDGAVEVLAAGTEEQFAALYTSLKRGSRGSRVDRIEVEERPAAEASTLQTFSIEGAW